MNKKAMLPSCYRNTHCLAQRKGVGPGIMTFRGCGGAGAGGQEGPQDTA